MRPGEFSVKDAAVACGVSESTIRRHLPSFSGAHRQAGKVGGWIIPAGDLVANGFTIDPTYRSHRDASPRVDEVTNQALTEEVRLLIAEVDELEREVGRLDQQNRELQRRAEEAEDLIAKQDTTIRELRDTRTLASGDERDIGGGVPDSAAAASLEAPTPPPSKRAQHLEAARRALGEISRHPSTS